MHRVVSDVENDAFWMQKALKLAQKAAERGEVPVGAVLVLDGQVLALGSNRREQWKTPLGHAELIAVQRASQKLGSWRLLNSTLYVTLEPCVMCAGALVQARISKLVYGARDPKGGAVDSLYRVAQDPRLNHQIEIVSGILENECSQILKDFFKMRRQQQKEP